VKILHVTPTFSPATYWGGPIYSVFGLCNALAQQPEVEVQVLTTDSAGPTVAQRLEIKEFPTHMEAGYPVYYCRRRWGASFSPAMMMRLRRMIRWADVVHLTVVYSPPTIPTLMLCRLIGKPVVWSPRGSLQRWDGATRKLTKHVWEFVCNLFCKVDQVTLHFTSESERVGSAGRIKRARSVVIPNGIEQPGNYAPRDWQPGGKLRLLYLGRLHPIKGIENLLHALSNTTQEVTLKLYGDGDPDYRHSLRVLAKKLNLDDRVQFNEHVSGEAKRNCFLNTDVCIVPSFIENFGMVVAEALAHGVPVIASRGTPWQRAEEIGCGLWRDNDPTSLAEAIMQIKTMPLVEMGEKGRVWVEKEYSWPRIAEKMLHVYQKIFNPLSSNYESVTAVKL
jgi:glycosyltransferase involved in cell wall biosynthesis